MSYDEGLSNSELVAAETCTTLQGATRELASLYCLWAGKFAGGCSRVCVVGESGYHIHPHPARPRSQMVSCVQSTAPFSKNGHIARKSEPRARGPWLARSFLGSATAPLNSQGAPAGASRQSVVEKDLPYKDNLFV
ncbi:hypothetical protein BDA96_01G358500 [Sorghum bicolor]|uniref:Uncharacterized protein n=2 Tax=Sorghum bicolor TaxID=4558 RepID=A0A921S3G7_SORBI|nr:hypothetical protein BDA96_01G358500 [Sorghum bicolor]KXG39121.1 hypothetical protein SORBI_3001G334800 [Sorghum bicolor]